MTELQKCELELLKCFISVCEKLQLKYFLVCGTALGAVKYGGFIPWDDDIDVALMRDDYRIFIDKAQELLPDHYFVQTFDTDPEYPNLFCKLRDSRTTFIEEGTEKLNINHGIYIDIFPLDGYPNSLGESKKLESKKRTARLKISCAFAPNKNQSLAARTLLKTERIFGVHKRAGKTAKALESLLSSYPVKDSLLCCNHGNWQGKLEYAPREQYGEGAEAEFEGVKVRIPEKCDEYLTQKYGDWRADLPEDQKTGHHFYKVLDTAKPYTEYVEKIGRGKIRIKTAN